MADKAVSFRKCAEHTQEESIGRDQNEWTRDVASDAGLPRETGRLSRRTGLVLPGDPIGEERRAGSAVDRDRAGVGDCLHGVLLRR